MRRLSTELKSGIPRRFYKGEGDALAPELKELKDVPSGLLQIIRAALLQKGQEHPGETENGIGRCPVGGGQFPETIIGAVDVIGPIQQIELRHHFTFSPETDIPPESTICRSGLRSTGS